MSLDEVPFSWQELRGVLMRPIAFHPIFAKIGGGVKAGLFLSQAFYWDARTDDPDGWFYKTQDEWEKETCLTRKEQEGARRELLKRHLIEEHRRGVPAQLYYRLRRDEILAAIARETNAAVWHNPDSPKGAIQYAPNGQSRMPDTGKQVRAKAPIKSAPKQQTLIGAESTSESTQKSRLSKFNDKILRACEIAFQELPLSARAAVEHTAQEKGIDYREVVLELHNYEATKVLRKL